MAEEKKVNNKTDSERRKIVKNIQDTDSRSQPANIISKINSYRMASGESVLPIGYIIFFIVIIAFMLWIVFR